METSDSASTAVGTLASGRGKSKTGSVKSSDSGESILTMSALEHALGRNPARLQAYSALHDYSGENIGFLTSVAEWRDSLLPGAGEGGSSADGQTGELVRERFNRALGIYTEFIGVRDAEFPINISSADLKRLEGVFEGAARALLGDKGDVDPVTPFDRLPGFSGKRAEGGETAAAAAAEKKGDASERARAQYWGEIPEAFDERVFDEAEKSIKYLVLTNTWPKFVRDGRASVEG